MRIKRAVARLLGGPVTGPPNVALLVDGPNCFRSEFDVDFDDLRGAADRYGRLAIARVYLDVNATPGLIQAAEAHGFEVIVTSGDVDVRLAVDATDIAAEGDVGVLAIATRDLDFKPAFEAAARHGLRTVAIAPGEHGRSKGLAQAVDHAITLGEA